MIKALFALMGYPILADQGVDSEDKVKAETGEGRGEFDEEKRGGNVRVYFSSSIFPRPFRVFRRQSPCTILSWVSEDRVILSVSVLFQCIFLFFLNKEAKCLV